ncbi:MAG TPA: hypothetical protein DDW76_06625 [Cyanobacteria bacterium UBA11369]|nr:hypothetical protein [Cyanobacteria bacterium UBA11371]HBE48476.1 hypothetical protein [Cyanobacteria bacterium UBA11369]
MKYFFLSEGWTVSRVWSSDGLWNEIAWRRKPNIVRLNLCLLEKNEILWLYRVEDAILTVEVKPIDPKQLSQAAQSIGHVILKRLITGDQVLERLGAAEATCQLVNIQSVVL